LPVPDPHHHRPQAQLTPRYASIPDEGRGGRRTAPARSPHREPAGRRLVTTYAVTALDGVAFGLLLFVVASGLTLIFGVMGVLNLAHGSFYLAGAALAYLISAGGLAGLAVAVAAGAAVGAASGAGLGVIMRPLERYGRLGQALATLGIALLAADAYNTVFG